MKLYYHPQSGHSHRVRLFLSLIDAKCEFIEVDLRKDEHLVQRRSVHDLRWRCERCHRNHPLHRRGRGVLARRQGRPARAGRLLVLAAASGQARVTESVRGAAYDQLGFRIFTADAAHQFGTTGWRNNVYR
jgi:hypothetical protein